MLLMEALLTSALGCFMPLWHSGASTSLCCSRTGATLVRGVVGSASMLKPVYSLAPVGNPGSDAPPSSSQLSTSSMWVRIASQWAIHALYAWTLVAPLVCTARDFS